MAETAARNATYEDILRAPEDKVAELMGGELWLSPRPGKPHAAAATALGEELGPPFKRGRNGPGGWILLFGPEVHLGRDVLVPDLGGWRRERLPSLTNEETYFTLAPDWACEVLSPASMGRDRVRKLPIYAAFGVAHVWLVDPLQRTLEILELSGDRYALAGLFEGNAVVRAVPFDAIELDLGILWADVVLDPISR